MGPYLSLSACIPMFSVHIPISRAYHAATSLTIKVASCDPNAVRFLVGVGGVRP